MILPTLLINSCTTPIEPLKIEPIEFEETKPPSDDIIKEIERIKANIGKIDKPKKITVDGKTYIAFTPEQLKKVTSKLELIEFLENAVEKQHNIMKLQVVQINELKRVTTIQQNELITMSQLVNRVEKQYNELAMRSQIDSIFYKVLMFGELLVFLLLI